MTFTHSMRIVSLPLEQLQKAKTSEEWLARLTNFQQFPQTNNKEKITLQKKPMAPQKRNTMIISTSTNLLKRSQDMRNWRRRMRNSSQREQPPVWNWPINQGKITWRRYLGSCNFTGGLKSHSTSPPITSIMNIKKIWRSMTGRTTSEEIKTRFSMRRW